ncbi:hypothetical protein BJY01DRAFT_18567 [Aspergillus pseudoustus]|uniref:Uncharacterized protein n=1 Tax=Aspergillus pseudoustus TaxID=1810923 RepID=A0ABR4KT19_9EURO
MVSGESHSSACLSRAQSFVCNERIAWPNASDMPAVFLSDVSAKLMCVCALLEMHKAPHGTGDPGDTLGAFPDPVPLSQAINSHRLVPSAGRSQNSGVGPSDLQTDSRSRRNGYDGVTVWEQTSLSLPRKLVLKGATAQTAQTARKRISRTTHTLKGNAMRVVRLHSVRCAIDLSHIGRVFWWHHGCYHWRPLDAKEI